MGLGALIAVIGLIGWHWPSDPPTTEEEEREFEAEYGIPVRTAGSRAVARAGMLLAILLIWIALACLLFSYFFIRLMNVSWPPETIPMPNWIIALSTTLIMLASAGVVYWAIKRIEENDLFKMRVGLGVVFVLGVLALGLQLYDYLQLPFGWQGHAYGSLFYTLGGLAFLVVLGGLLINALINLWALTGRYSARRHVIIGNLGLYWYSAVALWVVTFATLYVIPYIL
jgi:cytochrome c oxidase subunit 3